MPLSWTVRTAAQGGGGSASPAAFQGLVLCVGGGRLERQGLFQVRDKGEVTRREGSLEMATGPSCDARPPELDLSTMRAGEGQRGRAGSQVPRRQVQRCRCTESAPVDRKGDKRKPSGGHRGGAGRPGQGAGHPGQEASLVSGDPRVRINFEVGSGCIGG